MTVFSMGRSGGGNGLEYVWVKIWWLMSRSGIVGDTFPEGFEGLRCCGEFSGLPVAERCHDVPRWQPTSAFCINWSF